jgi:hypothetical protein
LVGDAADEQQYQDNQVSPGIIRQKQANPANPDVLDYRQNHPHRPKGYQHYQQQKEDAMPESPQPNLRIG